MVLYLVRHGRPLVDPATPAATWELDPSGYDDVWALRARLPGRAAWFCSPEPKATETAQLLTDGPVGIVDDLHELVRPAGWVDDFAGAVRRGFEHPAVPAFPGWESAADCRARVTGAVRPILTSHAGDDVVLVGHGTAWTLLVAALTGAPVDVERWAGLGLPDLLVVPDADTGTDTAAPWVS